MSYQFNQNEADKWKTPIWHTKGKDTPVDQLGERYAKNIVKYIGRRYNQKYFDTYIANSLLWLELARVAGTSTDRPSQEEKPVQAHNEPHVTSDDLPTSMLANSQKDIIINVLDNTIKGIDNGTVDLKQARDILSNLEIKLKAIL